MKQYLRTFRRCMHIAVADMATYRSDIILNLITGFVWAFVQIIFLEIIYSHTDSFAGWSKGDVLLLLLTFILTTEVLSNITKSLDSLSEQINRGNFDFLVLKPIDTQFLVLFGSPDLKGLFYFLTNIIPFIILLFAHPPTVISGNILIYLYLVLCGNIIWVCMKMIVVTFNFWWQKLENLQYLLYNITSLSKYPLTMFPKGMQAIFHTVIPVAFIAFIPVQILQGKSTVSYAVITTLVMLFIMLLSRLLWNVATRKYDSASS